MKFQVGVIKVEGEEAGSFLHAIVSSDIQDVQVGASQQSLLLEPSGKLTSAFWIFRSSDQTYLIVSSKNENEPILTNLKKFLIRTKATIEDVSDEFEGIISQNHGSGDFPIDVKFLNSENLYFSISKRSNQSSISASDDSLDFLRISNGIVSMEDLKGGIIPQEANLDKYSISFEKGCFLGQELVCRIDSRQASTPFKFFALHYEGLISSPPGTLGVSIDGEYVGQVTSIIVDKPIAFAEFGAFVGPFNAIAKLKRAGVQKLESGSDADRIYLESDDEKRSKFEVSEIIEVNGKLAI